MIKLITFLYVFPIICDMKMWQLSDIQELIVGGEPAKIEDVPYHVGFYYYDFYFCAGCIITPDHILTAAHCLVFLPGMKGLSIRAGSSKIRIGGQVTQVKNFTIHPKYSLTENDYDAAIVQLKVPLKFTKEVQPLKVGEKEPQDGEEVRVSGWGFTKETGAPSRKLRSVTVKVVDRKTCADSYKKIMPVTKRMICASGTEKDSCYGDSGGPLVHEGRIVGIVSWGEGCARKDFPGIYTNVLHPEIRNFIIKGTETSSSSKVNCRMFFSLPTALNTTILDFLLLMFNPLLYLASPFSGFLAKFSKNK